MTKTDQYGRKVPLLASLNLNVSLESLTGKEYEKIMALNWWDISNGKVRRGPYVNYFDLSKIIKEEIDSAFVRKDEEILRIDNCLKRSSDEDGFYSA